MHLNFLSGFINGGTSYTYKDKKLMEYGEIKKINKISLKY
jgi:hypothetical protein